jgi:hypothetical protein
MWLYGERCTQKGQQFGTQCLIKRSYYSLARRTVVQQAVPRRAAAAVVVHPASEVGADSLRLGCETSSRLLVVS